jgi:hypothetical protein
MQIVETKVCGKCGRKLRSGTSRCPACNINFYRRTPRLIFGLILVILFALFCSAIYFLVRFKTRTFVWLGGIAASPVLLGLELI